MTIFTVIRNLIYYYFQLHKKLLCVTCNSVRYHKCNYIFYYLCIYLLKEKFILLYLKTLMNTSDFNCFLSEMFIISKHKKIIILIYYLLLKVIRYLLV